MAASSYCCHYAKLPCRHKQNSITPPLFSQDRNDAVQTTLRCCSFVSLPLAITVAQPQTPPCALQLRQHLLLKLIRRIISSTPPAGQHLDFPLISCDDALLKRALPAQPTLNILFDVLLIP